MLNSFCHQHIQNCQKPLYRAVCTSDIDLLRDTLAKDRWDILNFMRVSFKDPINAELQGNKTLTDDWTVLHLATYYGKIELVQELLWNRQAKVDIHTLSFLYTPLMLAICKGHYELMQLLLLQGADANDSCGRQVFKKQIRSN